MIVNPPTYPACASTWHGFWLGRICFLIGFLFISVGPCGRRSAERTRHLAGATAFGLYLARQLGLSSPPNVVIAFESMAWMIAIWGFASRYLDRRSSALRYLASAVYPVYIVHMPVQFFFSSLIMPWAIAPFPKCALLVGLTLGGSLALYEDFKRIRWVRPPFGLKWNGKRHPPQTAERA